MTFLRPPARSGRVGIFSFHGFALIHPDLGKVHSLMPSEERSDVIVQYNELGQLAAGVGHHVINAFSAIVSNAELLRLMADSPNRGDPSAMADVIVRTAVEASAVARRLIDFSRAATATNPTPIALNELAREVVEVERAEGPDRVQWSTELEPVPGISGSPLQLRTMLHHLIANAYEALPESGGTITIVTRPDERGWVVLEVRDSGSGLLPNAQERAVEPFFTTKSGHFGVGLSIANGIWRRHRGTLAIRGRAGEGTTVRLCVEPERESEPARARV